ncbi:MAG: hypothetical protein LBR35_02530 [Rickettsiales bacterium]|jgi:hypothetical protein|nr:hypothetical protein [Rickettsiales bacterium]
MKKLAIFISLFLLGACATSPEPALTPQQKRAIQVRTFDTSVDMTFQAFKSVLQDDGYVIQNQDYAGGLLVAEGSTISGGNTPSSSGNGNTGLILSGILTTASLAVAATGKGNHNTVIAGNPNTREKVGQKYRLSVSLDKINSKTTESRLIIQKISQYNMGSETIEEYLNEDTYKLIYDKVNYEIKRRQALGR